MKVIAMFFSIIRRAFLIPVLFVFAMLAGSCASTGRFKPVLENEYPIGTIQTTFIARDSWLQKNETINIQAYIKLLEAAALKYPGEIDVRNIIWATGKYLGGVDVEVSATGTVVRTGTTGGQREGTDI